MVAITVDDVEHGEMFHYAGRQYVRSMPEDVASHPAAELPDTVLAYTVTDRKGNRTPVSFLSGVRVFVDRKDNEK